MTALSDLRHETPPDVDGLVAAMARAASAREAVAVAGGGTALGYGFPARRDGVAIATTALDRVVAYAPGDLVIEVEAGATLAAIAARTAQDGLRLALDPPQGERATIGGAVAVNAFGPLRARYGSLRDLVVGMSLVRADGALVRGGGRVVKNVAGFDVPKLAIGSLGTLGAIATVTLRLHPLPAIAGALAGELADLDAVASLELALEAERLEPAATLAVRAPGASGWRFAIVFEGRAEGVAEQIARATALAARRGVTLADVDAVAERARDAEIRLAGPLRLQLAVPRAALGALEAIVAALARALPDAGVVVYPALGIAFASAAVADAEAALAALAAARDALESLGGRLTAIDAGRLAGRIDPFGSPPPGLGLMRALRHRFDPERRLNPGRFLGGL